MTRAEVEQTMSSIISYDNLILKIDQSGGVLSIPLDNFVSRFESSELTYHSLSSATIIGDGWQPYFDAWKAQGLIN